MSAASPKCVQCGAPTAFFMLDGRRRVFACDAHFFEVNLALRLQRWLREHDEPNPQSKIASKASDNSEWEQV